MKLEGRVALVTGGAGGIGLELVRALVADFGARGVACVDNNDARLDAARAQLVQEDLAARVSFHRVDVSDRDQLQALCDEVLRRWDSLEILFNNAGVVFSNSLEDHTWEDLDLAFNVNVRGVVDATKIFLPHLGKADEAYVVNTSSLEGILAVPGNISYCTSKFAVRGFSEALMLDNKFLRPNVRVCCVHPGFVQTNMLSHNRDRIKTTTLTPDLKPSMQLRFEQIEAGFKGIGSTTPRAAALQILRGIRRNQTRVMVGNDSLILDWITRLFPRLIYRLPVYTVVLGGVLGLVKIVGKRVLAATLLLLFLRKRLAR